MLVTWGTNISINYGNEYFDWNMDRPGQIQAMTRDLERKRALASKTSGKDVDISSKKTREKGEDAPEYVQSAAKKQLNEKIMGNTTRIIHDGTFPPWIALLLCAVVQIALIGMILFSRSLDPNINPSSSSTRHTPFRGVSLFIGVASTFLSQEYVGPPLQLHYHGWGEIISSLFLSPVSLLWGLTGYYTATHPALLSRSIISPTDLLFPPTIGQFGIDSTLWILLIAAYCTEQARVLIMHIHDIDADIAGGKITLVVRLGYERAAQLYVALNVVGVTLWGTVLKRLSEGKVTMLNTAVSTFWGMGKGLESQAASNVGKIWAIGIGIVLAYSIPIMVLTATSLFANKPNQPKAAAGIIPIVPHMELVKLVSLQLLITAPVLSITAVVAGRA